MTNPTPAHEVVIDGVIYVPATEAIPQVDHVLQAIYESYMGNGEHWSECPYPLWVRVNEDRDGETLTELAARIAKIAGRDD